MQFADIKNDIAFRKIFGNENKKEILISFLNAVLDLEGNKKITWVEILNPYQFPKIAGLKSTILDVRAKDKAGHSYIVEMQVADKKGFDKRITFYSSKTYAAQINSGEEYYKLKPTIFIGILNFEYLKNLDYLSRHAILDTKTYEQNRSADQLKDLEFYFIELPKFNKTEQELTDLVEKWVYFIKNAENLNVIPASVNDEGLKSAYQEADQHTWTKEEVEEYEYARMRDTDEIAREMLILEKIAKSLLQTALTNEDIAKHTGLTVEQIEQLQSAKE
jgi:predicted transposase/invertase (TIGR01784 family)